MSKLEQAIEIQQKLKKCRDTLYKFFTVIKATGEQEYRERIGLFQFLLDARKNEYNLPGILESAIHWGNDTEDGMDLINIFAAAYEDQTGNDFRQSYSDKIQRKK